MPLPRRTVGYAIVSEDGMIAGADGVMPQTLQLEADQRFFEHGLDAVEAVVQGRHSHEHQARSQLRRRIILTRAIAGIEPDRSDPQILYWNPAGATFKEAWTALDLPDGRLGVIGGTQVFGMFLPAYDAFFLSRAAHVRLPGGRPVFPEVPARTPEDVLTSHGLKPSPPLTLDAEKGLTVVEWRR